MLDWEAQRELTGARLTHEGILAFCPEESMPSLMTFPNPGMEYVVALLRLHSRSSCQCRAALFSVVLELHKSKVYRFSYLDFCATAFIRRIAAFVLTIPSLLILRGTFWCLQKKKLVFQPLNLTDLINAGSNWAVKWQSVWCWLTGFVSLMYNVAFWMSVCWLDVYKTRRETKRRCAANDYWLMWTESDSNNSSMNRQTGWQSDETFPPPEAVLPEFPFQSLAHS